MRRGASSGQSQEYMGATRVCNEGQKPSEGKWSTQRYSRQCPDSTKSTGRREKGTHTHFLPQLERLGQPL
eukprot:8043584-Heterocapsa_arctica.AAC.1